MGTITESITSGVDVSTAYGQWTQFQSFAADAEPRQLLLPHLDQDLGGAT